jgi:hypothetical protein
MPGRHETGRIHADPGGRVKVQHEKGSPPRRWLKTARQRQFPDFIIIGTQRGGTTSLYEYLTAHPDVGAAYRKEVHFFDRHFGKGIDWYRAHFPLAGEFSVVGEASPYYLFHPSVPERLHEVIPAVKLIALLRNPVDRALSQYHMKVSRGLESLTFEDAIQRESERLSASDNPMGAAWRHHSYLARGRYAEQLLRWLRVFPRVQLLILKSEDLFAEPQRVLGQVQHYLGLGPHTPAQFTLHHKATYSAMDAATRQRLEEYFAPHNRTLYALLGCDFAWEAE